MEPADDMIFQVLDGRITIPLLRLRDRNSRILQHNIRIKTEGMHTGRKVSITLAATAIVVL